MIAGITSDYQIDALLYAPEIKSLAHEVVEGSLLYCQDPKKQGKLILEVHDPLKKEFCKNSSIGIDNSSFRDIFPNHGGFLLKVYLDRKSYQTLRDDGFFKSNTPFYEGGIIQFHDASRLEGFDGGIFHPLPKSYEYEHREEVSLEE